MIEDPPLTTILYLYQNTERQRKKRLIFTEKKKRKKIIFTEEKDFTEEKEKRKDFTTYLLYVILL